MSSDLPQFLSEGYAVHLSSLQFSHRARPKKSSSVRMVLRKGSFGLSAKPDFLCKRTHLRRTMSVQQPEPPMTSNPKPERAQSQPESDKDHGGGGGPGHALWARGSMHRGDTTPWPKRNIAGMEPDSGGQSSGKL